VQALHQQIRLYVEPGHANYGKVAKRLYNVFRLTGHHAEAAYLRELFDEDGAVLYQVASHIGTVDEAMSAQFDRGPIAVQLDMLVLQVVALLDGQQELDLVTSLLMLRAAILDDAPDRGEQVEAASNALLSQVNDFFYARLMAVPSIADYLARMPEPGR